MYKQILSNFIANKNLFVSLYINIAIIPIIYFLMNTSFNLYYFWISFFVFIAMKSIGVEAGNHRLFSHRTYKTSRPIKILFLLLSALSGSGSPIIWAGIHRYNHHRHSDKETDPHSPIHGFWHSYITWMVKVGEKDINLRSIVDLLRDNDIVFFHKHSTSIFWLANIVLYLLDPKLLIFGLLIPAFITFHSYCLQTSVVHIKKFGYRNFQTNDNSTNCAWIFPIAWGESWHNNHHARPGQLTFKEKWWELDPTYWIILLVKK